MENADAAYRVGELDREWEKEGYSDAMSRMHLRRLNVYAMAMNDIATGRLNPVEIANKAYSVARAAGEEVMNEWRRQVVEEERRDKEYEQDRIMSQCEAGGWDYRGN